MKKSEISAVDRIDSSLPEELKELMKQHVLSKEEHEIVLQDIKKQSYEGKNPVEKPKFIIAVGQTGSGKSNLTASIINQNDNIVVIDSDKYKAYRADSSEILKNHLAEYAFLTGPDAYLHRDEMIEDAMSSKYNILMECAPSRKAGLFVDIPEIREQGYDIELHVLGVSALNSVISVHERYEAWLEAGNSSAKLTNINRHDDSFEALNKIIRQEQNREGMEIKVYKRGENPPYMPKMVYSPEDKKAKYSCPYEALLKIQDLDKQKTVSTAEGRIEALKQQMDKRNAPESQVKQLEEVENRHREIAQKDIEGISK